MSSRIQGVAMILAKYYPELGGAERQARLLCRYLAKMNIQALVFTRNYHHGPVREKIDAAWVIRSPTFGKVRAINSFLFILFSLWQLWRKRSQFQIIHCHQTYSPMTVGVLAGWLLRKPVVVKVTASNEYGEVNELRRLPFFQIRLFLLRQVRKFMVVNPRVIEELQTLGIASDLAVWIPNGVEIPQPCALDREAKMISREKLGLHQGQFVLVFSGRLSAEKGLFEILAAWEQITRKFPKTKLFLIGEGGSQRSVEREIKKLVVEKGMSHCVEFTGRVDVVLPYLIAADGFILPSVSEGMSNSLLEAMACGLACIATDIPATRALMENNREGISVPVGDAQALFEAIEEIFNNQEKAREIGANAREKVARLCNMDRISREVLKIYESVSKE